jgi:Transmembrane protein 43
MISIGGSSASSGSNSGSSIFGFIIGIFIFIASFPILWYNEKRGVMIMKIIDEGLNECTEVHNGRAMRENNGRLVCAHGELISHQDAIDHSTGITTKNALVLIREVEYYQEVEKKKEDEQYVYEKGWYSLPIDSKNFENPDCRGKNERKTITHYEPDKFTADSISLGEYELNSELKEMITCEENLKLEGIGNILIDQIRSKTGKHIIVSENYLYIKKNENLSKFNIGDMRIYYRYYAGPRSCTIVAVQKNQSFEAFYGKNVNPPEKSYELESNNEPKELKENLIKNNENKTHAKDYKDQSICGAIKKFMDDSIKIMWLFEGNVPLKNCFEIKLNQEKKITWLLRLVGFILMTLGVYLFFGPLLALVQWIPILGTLISFIFFLVSLSIGFSLSLITIAIAWLFYRPIVGFFMITGAVMIYIFTIYLI